MCRRVLIGILTSLVMGCARMDQDADPARPEAVRIGVLVALSGTYGFDPSVEAAARLAADEINQAGGVNGKPLQIRMANDLSTPATGILGARGLLDEGVVGIVGCSSSSVTMAVAREVTIQAGIPMISPASTSPLITGLEDKGTVWRTIPSDVFQGVILADQMRSQGLSRVGVIFVDNAYGNGLAQAFRSRFEASGGAVTGFAPYGDGKSVGFTREVAALLAGGTPEGVLIVGYLADSANITWDLLQAGPTPRPRLFGVDGNYDPSFLSNAASPLTEGMEGTSPSPPDPWPAYDRFYATLPGRTGIIPQLYAATAYDAVYLMALAMARSRTNTAPGILANLQAVSAPSGSPGDVIAQPGQFAQAVAALQAGRHVNFEGASGSVDLDANGDVTTGAYRWWKVVRGAGGKLRYESQKVIRFP